MCSEEHHACQGIKNLLTHMPLQPINRTIAAGFQAHLDKPFASDSLLEAIKSILKS
jgi:CheY-like chemotaxis protein